MAYSTVGTLPPPHDYMPHAKAFGNYFVLLAGTLNIITTLAFITLYIHRVVAMTIKHNVICLTS